MAEPKQDLSWLDASSSPVSGAAAPPLPSQTSSNWLDAGSSPVASQQAASSAPQKEETSIAGLAKKYLWDPMYGNLEAGAQLATGLASMVPAAAMSVYHQSTDDPNLDKGTTANSIADMQKAFTFQPQTDAGKFYGRVLGLPGEAIGWMRDKMMEYGSQSDPRAPGSTWTQRLAMNAAPAFDFGSNAALALVGLKGKYAPMAEAADSARANIALTKIDQRMKRDKTDFATAAQQTKEANEAGVDARLPDIAGQNTVRTAEVIAQHPGDASEAIAQDRNAIKKNAPGRIGDRVTDALQASGSGQVESEVLARNRSKAANRNYLAVQQDATPVMNPVIWEELDDPVIANIYQKARQAHENSRGMAERNGTPLPPAAEIYRQEQVPVRGTPPPEPGVIDTSAMREPPQPPPEPGPDATPVMETRWVRNGTAPDVHSLDLLVRGLDKEVREQYTRSGGDAKGTASVDPKMLRATRDRIKTALEQESPAYTLANKTYASDSEILDHYEKGRSGEFLDNDPQVAWRIANSAPEAAKNALREGVREYLLHDAEHKAAAAKGNLSEKIMGGEKTTDNLRALFDDDSKFETFKKWMELEQRVHLNNNRIMGGSPTYGRAEAGADFEQTSALSRRVGAASRAMGYLHSGYLGAAFQGLLRAMDTGSLWDEGLAHHVQTVLSSKDPAAAADELVQLGKLADQVRSGRRMLAPAVVNAVGSAQAQPQPDPRMQALMQKYSASPAGAPPQ